MINQVFTTDKSPIQQQLSELWNVLPSDDDYLPRVEMILREFNNVFSSYVSPDQTRMKKRILKKLDLLRETLDPYEVFAKIISIDIGIQFLDPALSNIGKFAPFEEAHALRNLSKKSYIPICSIVERYEKLCRLFDFPSKDKLMENLLHRKDRTLLTLEARVSLYVNFPEIYPIKNQLFNFIKEHPHNILADIPRFECKNVHIQKLLWNIIKPEGRDERIKNFKLQFTEAYANLVTTDQIRLKKNIIKKVEYLKNYQHPLDKIGDIASIDIRIQFLDQVNEVKYFPYESPTLNNLAKKTYISIGSIVERYQKICDYSFYSNKNVLMENLLKREDRSLLTLEHRISLYFNFLKNSHPINEQLFNFMIEGCKERNQLTLTKGKELSVIKLFPNLTALKIIKGSHLNDSVFKAISDLKLETLIFDGAGEDNCIEGHGLESIVKMPLKTLTLRGFPLTDAAMPHIVKMTDIENLDISDTHITDHGLINLDKAQNIKKLSLASCDLTKRGVFYIKNMDIQELNLGWIEDFEKNGMEDVIQSLLHMKKLNTLDLRGAKITPEELIDLSNLPLQFIDLRQRIDKEQLCLQALFDFALEIKNKHSIHVTCRYGNVLEWEECKLNENSEFIITNFKRDV